MSFPLDHVVSLLRSGKKPSSAEALRAVSAVIASTATSVPIPIFMLRLIMCSSLVAVLVSSLPGHRAAAGPPAEVPEVSDPDVGIRGDRPIALATGSSNRALRLPSHRAGRVCAHAAGISPPERDAALSGPRCAGEQPRGHIRLARAASECPGIGRWPKRARSCNE